MERQLTTSHVLTTILKPLVESSKRQLKETRELIESMKNVVLDENGILVSYDVTSLFTNAPVEESIKNI